MADTKPKAAAMQSAFPLRLLYERKPLPVGASDESDDPIVIGRNERLVTSKCHHLLTVCRSRIGCVGRGGRLHVIWNLHKRSDVDTGRAEINLVT